MACLFLILEKRKKPLHLDIVINQMPILQLRDHKHLEIVTSDDARWISHISFVIDKVWQRIGILRSLLKYSCPGHTLFLCSLVYNFN